MNMMKRLPILILLVLLATAKIAWAEIYKRIDENGRIVYSNIKTQGATRLDISPEVNSIKDDRPKASANAGQAKQASPESFPRVDRQTQEQRDDKRKEILMAELEAEKEALLQAQQAYAEGESKPEVYRKKNADGSTSTYRNMAKYNTKMDALKTEVDSHQNNIQMLQKEINALQ
jgi:hypothetical protein